MYHIDISNKIHYNIKKEVIFYNILVVFSINSILFSDNFAFHTVHFTKYKYTDSRQGSPRHFLAVLIHGTAKIVSKEFTLEINEGDLFYIPKNLPYQSYWYGDKNGDIEFVSIGFHVLHTDEPLNFPLQVVDCPTSVKESLLSVPTDESLISSHGLSLFYNATSLILPLLKSTKKNSALTENIKNHIRQFPFLPISVIAEKCGLSEPYIYLLFKKNEHSTPNAYRQKVLCEKSVELLITTDKKVEEIADITGFSSASYFRKVLKHHTGKTPRDIRKEGRV